MAAMMTPRVRAQTAPENRPMPAKNATRPTRMWIQPQVVTSNLKIHFWVVT